MAADTSAKDLYGDGELPGDADLDTSGASGVDDADDRDKDRSVEKDTADDNPAEDNPADEIVDLMPGGGMSDEDQPDSSLPLP